MDPRPPSAPAPSGLALFGSIRAIGAITAVATLVSALATAATGPWAEAPEAKARIVSRWAVAPAGGDAGLGLEFSLLPGWHVYWKNSGDAGYPPELELAQDAGLGATTLRYPAPHRFELPGDLVAFGYEGEVVYPIDAAVAADATGTLALSGRLDYLVCREECIPYTADLALELPMGDAAEDPERAPALDAWRARLPIAPGDAQPPVLVTMDWHAGEYPWSTFELRLAAPGLSASAPDLFFAPQEWVELRRPELVATAAGPTFRVPVRALDETKPLPEPLALEWTATGFELGGAPLALSGTTSLSPVAAASRAKLYWILALASLAALLALARKLNPRQPRRSGVPT